MSKIEPLPARESLTITQAIPVKAVPVGNTHLRKPDGWPAVMHWPPKRVSDAIRNGTLNEGNAHKFQEYYDKYAQLTVRQAERFGAHLRRRSSRNEDVRDFIFFKKKKRFGYDDTRNHDHVAWAFILDPNADFQSSYNQTVMSIGRSSLTTIDGGKVRVTENGLTVKTYSPMAAQVIVEEALARGWDHINVTGSRKLVEEVIKQAKAQGLAVNARVTWGPFGMKTPVDSMRYSMESMGMDQAAHEELADLGKQLAAPDKEGGSQPEVKVEKSGDDISLV